MKKLLAFLACLTLISVSSLAYESDYYSYSYARLSYVSGDVFIQRAEELGYEEGIVNLAMIEGDKLGTREGRAEIHFGRRNYLRIDANTQIDLAQLPQRGFDLIKLHLLSGSIFLRINHLEREKDFEVHTPDGSFYILEEGLYLIKVKSEYETELHVLEGAVEAAGETGSVLVESDESIVTADGRLISGPHYFHASYADSFYEWNKSRDEVHNRYVTRTYLPAEIYEYEAELAYYGDWVYEGSYGYVWIPRVHHSTWRPYWNGRWVWYPIIGWNWISYDPWGWCVSHYGRWHWRLGLGWYWIPTRYWGPAWVHWYHGPDYYGWCPLSYYDYPGIIINNHFYARHNYRTYPTHSRTLVVVHKNQLQARHISRVALSGTQVRGLDKVSLTSRQPGVSPTISRSEAIHSKAARTLSRTNVRQVGKAYGSDNALGTGSRASSSRARASSRNEGRPDSLRKGSSSGLSNSRVSSRNPADSTSVKRSRSEEDTPSSSARFSRSSSGIKTFPSRRESVSSPGRRASPSSVRPESKARVTTRSPSQADETYVPGRSIKYYRSRNSSQDSSNNERSSSSDSKESKAKTTRSKQDFSARGYSSQEPASRSSYRASSNVRPSAMRSASTRYSSRVSSSRSIRSQEKYSTPSRSYARSRTSPSTYSAPSRSSSSPRSSYTRSQKSPSRGFSQSSQSRSSRSSSSSRSSGRASSSSSKSSSKSRKK